MGKEATLQIRMSENLKAQWQREAEALGMTLTEFVIEGVSAFEVDQLPIVMEHYEKTGDNRPYIATRGWYMEKGESAKQIRRCARVTTSR